MGNSSWRLLAVACVALVGVLAGFAVSPAQAQVRASGCKVPLPEDVEWRPQERWAWEERICVGKRANLAEYVEQTTGKKISCNPTKTKDWPRQTRLSSRFMEAIMREDGFLTVLEDKGIEIFGLKSLLPNRGVEIQCARFSDKLDLKNAIFERPLVLLRSRLDKGIDLVRFKSSSSVVLFRVASGGPINAFGARVKGDFWIKGGSIIGDKLNLISADVGRTLEIEKSAITDDFLADNLFVGGAMRLRHDARFKNVRLRSARIGQSLSFTGAKVSGTLDASLARVGGVLNFDAGEFGTILLRYAEVDDILSMLKASFTGPVDAYSVKVGDSVFMRDESHFHNEVKFSNALIGGTVEFRGSTFEGAVDFTNAKVEQELQLSSPKPLFLQTPEEPNYRPPTWGDDASLILRNTRVQALQDTSESWENLDGRLDLVGFTYEQLGGTRATKESTLAARPLEWLLSWLALQKDRHDVYSPQPYEQLAGSLRSLGWTEKADKVLYAKEAYHLKHGTTPQHTKAWLFIKWLFIGFGLKTWVSLIWIGGLISTGAFVARLTQTGREHGFGASLFYSIDMAVPFLDLDPGEQEAFAKTMPSSVKYYFGFQRALGLVLASFLAAGLSGLAGGG